MIRQDKYHNGTKIQHTFSEAEYKRRQDKLKAWMADNDIDVIIFNSIHNINYYSDFLYCSFGRKYGLVVTQDAVTTVSAGIDGGQPFRRTVGDNITYTDWHKDNFWYALSGLVKSTARKVAIEFDFVSVEMQRRFQGIFPTAEIIDCSTPVMFMRTIKSDEEIALIKHGAQIADIGGAACVEAIAEGVPEHEIALHSTGKMVREIANRFPHAELMDTWTWFQSGINTDGAHNPVTSRKLERGDILSLNCFPMIAGYYTALERTLFCEEVSDEHLKLWEINVKVHERGLELIKPGAVCSEIAKELNEIYASHDLLQYRSFGYGHSFGTLCHYYGREAGLELREDIDTVLEPNMVVSMEPMIMLPEDKPGAGGYREHDILVVNESGAENITAFPYGPEHNIIKK